jgi:biotin carboxyl carrier protein
MKMENELRAPGNCVIREIRVNREDEVTLGQPLLVLDIQ